MKQEGTQFIRITLETVNSTRKASLHIIYFSYFDFYKVKYLQVYKRQVYRANGWTDYDKTTWYLYLLHVHPIVCKKAEVISTTEAAGKH